MTVPSPLRPAATRRDLLRVGLFGGLGLTLLGGAPAIATPRRQRFGPLGPPDEHGVQVPEGFRCRLVAQSGLPVGRREYLWHAHPDGGATFPTEDGGWIYVSNSEDWDDRGGVGALRFGPDGEVQDAYRILRGTNMNCAGGPTPWRTWLSGEEHDRGLVWECDPYTPDSQGVARPALGRFKHEAAAVDPVGQAVYLTEDVPNGRFYRCRLESYPSLESGVLEAMEVLDPEGRGRMELGEVREVRWHPVPDPDFARGVPTREQVPASTAFNGGEGCWYSDGTVTFSTKGTNRVWQLDTVRQRLKLIYDSNATPEAALRNVDNVFVAPGGDVYVAEDPGNLEIVALTVEGDVVPIVRVVDNEGSEITGPCLSPDGTRLYFSSQRYPGRTFEVSGPFLA